MFDQAYNTKSNNFYHMFKGMKPHFKFNQETWEKHLLILNWFLDKQYQYVW